ncbi:maleylpyruvate isomerase family mycothiol-dependent enzyme [Metallococcus carri]|uniref:maleylpyruvate isomerase family mycothiol-dependent enzyme n=1 Tax=Metallococcus carri TaxID=1656884 RepID=UPI001A9DEB46|nr:maleylpyruvate isomerase family mycothiol-dependent enzyme [Metallococcus carri]
MSTGDTRRMTDEGTELFVQTVDGIADAQFAEPSALPGWTRAHLIAHVADNADALGNLVHWAATGVETPMYASAAQREADIERGAGQPPSELRARVKLSADRLAQAFDALTPEAWAREVRTSKGLPVPASATVWMRAREVLIHSVDLAVGVGFTDLPRDFLVQLVGDITRQRSRGDGPALDLVADDGAGRWQVSGANGSGDQATRVTGSLPAIAAYLAGRPGPALTSEAPPQLPPWL